MDEVRLEGGRTQWSVEGLPEEYGPGAKGVRVGRRWESAVLNLLGTYPVHE